MLTRRTIAAAPFALAACATAPRAPDPMLVLRRAIDAAGGERALRDARVLAWTGEAVIHLDDQDIAIGVDTVVEPFVYARSESWLLSQGRSSTRILEIDQTVGWATRNGERTPLPALQAEHERKQYALYGLMQLVTLLDPAAHLSTTLWTPSHGDGPVAMNGLDVEHPRAPRTSMYFGDDGLIELVMNSVPHPEVTGAELTQIIGFDGFIEGGGVRWPRQMHIAQGDPTRSEGIGTRIKPFFDLTLHSFTPRQRR